MCWLKSALGTRAVNPDVVSGVKRDLRGINIWGNDYKDYVPSPASAAQCEKDCRAESRCRAYTFVDATTRCWLKTGVGDTFAANNMTSGIKLGLSYNTDTTGPSYANVSASSPRACQASCNSDTRCKSFVHVPSALGSSRGTCYLKNSISESFMVPRYVSGIKGAEFM